MKINKGNNRIYDILIKFYAAFKCTHTHHPVNDAIALLCVGTRSKLLPGIFLGSTPYCVLVHLGGLELIDNVINHMGESENKQRPC